MMEATPERECPNCNGEGTVGTSWRMDPETSCYDEIRCRICYGRGILGGSPYDLLAAKHPELFHEEIVWMLTPPTGEEVPF